MTCEAMLANEILNRLVASTLQRPLADRRPSLYPVPYVESGEVVQDWSSLVLALPLNWFSSKWHREMALDF